MGIKNFSRIFQGKEIKMRNLKNLTGVVDASVIAYAAALGMKNINALTDADGNPTIHINVVIAKCLNFQKAGMKQVWVFDFHEKGYINPDKAGELIKRKKVKDGADKKLKALHEQKRNMFSSDDEDEDTTNDIDTKIQQQERVGFSVNDKIINDIKFILNCFDIQWCDAPRGFEAEHIAALLTDPENDDAIADLVWTTDTDAIIYGASQIVRELKVKTKKVLMLYELDKIMDDNDLTRSDLHKIAVIAGCDHCEKTPKIGAKTILKKFKEVELTDQQKDAMKVFNKTYDITTLNWNNEDAEPFEKPAKIDTLLNWLVSKNFNRERIKKQISAVL